jgi:hydroxymethylpyrimidine pyrophosphatase-like HAD family hydrolase
MSVPSEKVEAVAKALLEGAIVLSDNDGTLAPFTQSPTQTIIPAETMDAIREFQSIFGINRFIPISGRPEKGLREVFERSSDQLFEAPTISDDGAVFTNGTAREEILLPLEKDFIEYSRQAILQFIEELPSEQRNRVDLELKANGVSINTNKVHAELGADTADFLKGSIADLFASICEDSPVHNNKPCFAIHYPPGHGLEIRSIRTTKRMGLEYLIEKNVIPSNARLIFMGDDLKHGGNDSELAEFVQKRGGFVIQIKHADPLRAFPDENRAIVPDIVLHEPASISAFLNKVLMIVKEELKTENKHAFGIPYI